MKNLFLTVITSALFLGALFFSISTNSEGKLTFLNKANAVVDNGKFHNVYAVCPDGINTYRYCNVGTENCFSFLCP